jgi:hypothetical protein
MTSETRWSARWLRLAFLVMMVLATIGAWEIVKMAGRGGSAHADGVFDHLTCYDVRSSKGSDDRHRIDPKALVRLSDQFFPTGVEAEVRQLRLLCTQAIKTRIP